MFVSDKVKTKITMTSYLFLVLVLISPMSKAVEKLTLGQPATAAEIAGWDIDIRPDGKGLPAGRGNAIDGEDMFIKKCASCHGEFAEGAGRYPVLAGGINSLNTHDPVKTVGSYWPYATTAFDYIRRAMPFGHAQSLSNDEVYSMTAYILYSNDIIEDDFELNQNTLALVEMPNRNGFIKDARPDVPMGEPCMKNCLAKMPVVTGKARQVDVTPDEELSTNDDDSSGDSDADVSQGKAVFGQCIACHSIAKGENKMGPSLYALFDRKAGGVASFSNYSAAMSSSDTVWSATSLSQFLSSPQGYMPGTSMPFGGIKDADDLSDLIEFLRTTTAN